MKNKWRMESNTDHIAAVWQLLTSYILAFVKKFSLKSESNGFPSEQLVCSQIIGPKSHCSGGKKEQLCAPMRCFQTSLPCGQPAGRGAVFVGDMILVEVELVIPSVLSLWVSPESNQTLMYLLCSVAVTITSSFGGTSYLVAQHFDFFFLNQVPLAPEVNFWQTKYVLIKPQYPRRSSCSAATLVPRDPL